MAFIYHAEISPTKLQLVTTWAPTQLWFPGDSGAEFSLVASYRFDDPAGEVGIETLLVRAGDGPVLQIPLTYRGAPLAGAEAWLITTMTHSVLGERWVYDATGDPVYLAAVARAALTGGHEAEQFHDVDGVKVLRPSTATVSGSGEPGASVVTMPHIEAVSTEQATESTVVETDALRLVVMRLPGAEGGAAPEATAVLTGTWAGQQEPHLLVSVTLR